VDFDALHTEGGGTVYGAVEGIEPVAMTDANGEFLLASEKPFVAMSVTVEAHGLAKRRSQRLESGRRRELRPLKGNAVTGRLVANGKLVSEATVGLLGVDRSMEDSIGNYVAVTDAQGRFRFPNLPTEADCNLYSPMCEGGVNGGVAPLRRFRTGSNGAASELGDLIIEPAFGVAGRVVLSDGNPWTRPCRRDLEERPWPEWANCFGTCCPAANNSAGQRPTLLITPMPSAPRPGW